MSENTTYQNSELLRDISEQEQEMLVAGENSNLVNEGNLFLQKINLESQAENTLNLKSGDFSFQKAKYNLSNITIGYSIKFGLPDFKPLENSTNTIIPKLLKSLG